jgi:prenyltransferase/squalene oxidase-like repeat protein
MKIPASALAAIALCLPAIGAEPARVDVQPNIDRGLDWLARQQDRNEGHWVAHSGQYPTSMTAMAAMPFLLEGSTLREGKYSTNLRKAVDWFLKRSQPNGLLGNPNNPTEANHYMHGHGYALLFLACVYGDEDDEKRRHDLERVLTKAVEFSGNTQTTMGGWGYVSAAENGDWDEGSVTVTQLQALRAARNAGIPVPKSVIDKAVKYLQDCTNPDGGIRYEFRHHGPSRPPITAAGVACAFSAGDYNSAFAKKWIAFCQRTIRPGNTRTPHFEYQSYYLAQAVYVLGEDRYKQLFPTAPDVDCLKWSQFRETMFAYLKSTQAADGSWPGAYVGPIFGTATALTIFELENNALPIYMR